MKERHRAAGLDAHATENGDVPLRKRQSLADVTGGARQQRGRQPPEQSNFEKLLCSNKNTIARWPE